MAWFYRLTPAQIEQLPAHLQEQYRAKLASQNGCPIDLDKPITDPAEIECVRQWWNEIVEQQHQAYKEIAPRLADVSQMLAENPIAHKSERRAW